MFKETLFHYLTEFNVSVYYEQGSSLLMALVTRTVKRWCHGNQTGSPLHQMKKWLRMRRSKYSAV